MPTTTMIPQQTITAIVEAVQQAQTDAAEAFRLLQRAKDTLGLTLGTGTYRFNALWDNTLSEYSMERNAQEVHRHIEENAWRYLIDQTGMREYLTPQRQAELDDQFKKHTLPELTAQNVSASLLTMAHEAPGHLEELALQVFSWLRPTSTTSRAGKLKTNQKWKIGEKVIIPGVFGDWGQLAWGRTEYLRMLDTVFHLLDGQGVPRYPHTLETVLRAAKDAKQTTAETWYAHMHWYGNGNMHVRFLRPDLVGALNRIGADASLPGAA